MLFIDLCKESDKQVVQTAEEKRKKQHPERSKNATDIEILIRIKKPDESVHIVCQKDRHGGDVDEREDPGDQLV